MLRRLCKPRSWGSKDERLSWKLTGQAAWMMCVVVLSISPKAAGERPRSGAVRSLVRMVALKFRNDAESCRASSAARTRSTGLI